MHPLMGANVVVMAETRGSPTSLATLRSPLVATAPCAEPRCSPAA